MGVTAPLIGDFHYIGHKLLADHPACAEALDKYRINPGNVGFKNKRDKQFSQIVEMAIRHGKTVRIGANWGSLDQELLTHLMDENAHSADADRRAGGDARSDGAIGAAVGGAGRGNRPGARPDHPVGQGFGGAGSHRRLSHDGRAIGLRAAPWPDRSGHGLQGHRRLLGRDRRSAAGGDRRHDPRLADARSRAATARWK